MEANREAPSNLTNSFRDWLDRVLNEEGWEAAERFSTLCWQLWKLRNDMVFEHINTPPRLGVSRALDWAAEYKIALGPLNKVVPDKRSERWRCPPLNVVKINFDAAYHKDDDKYGLGFIARDSKGIFLLAGSKTVWHCGSVEEAEARAMGWALSVAANQSWPRIILEGDCKTIIDTLNGGGRRHYSVQAILDNLLVAGAQFSSLVFSFCYRVCNSGAHRLARWAVSGVSDRVWVECPIWLSDIMYSDISSS